MLWKIGRQAVLGADLVPAAYWLLPPSASNRHIFPNDESWRMRETLSDMKCYFGTEAFAEGKTAFVTFTEGMLREEFAFLTAPEELVVGVPGTILVDAELEERLDHLRRAGYRIALTGYSELTARLRFDRIIEKFDYICVNVRDTSFLKLKDLMRRLRRSHAVLMAEGVDTEAEFDHVRELDFAMYRGMYLAPPEELRTELPPLANAAYGVLLNRLLSPGLDPNLCLEAVQQEMILYYLMIRQTDELVSARSRIQRALRSRMMELGPGDLLHWCSVVMLRRRNIHATEELSYRAYLRGAFAERLTEKSALAVPPFHAFLLGIFSLLDKVTGIRMEDLCGLSLPPELKAALLGQGENEFALLLQFVMIHEMRQDARLSRLILPDIGLTLPNTAVEQLYQTCCEEAEYEFQLRFLLPRVYSGNLLR